jgi:hypothetical protein
MHVQLVFGARKERYLSTWSRMSGGKSPSMRRRREKSAVRRLVGRQVRVRLKDAARVHEPVDEDERRSCRVEGMLYLERRKGV